MDIEQRLKNVESFLKNKIIEGVGGSRSPFMIILIIMILIISVWFYGNVKVMQEKIYALEDVVFVHGIYKKIMEDK